MRLLKCLLPVLVLLLVEGSSARPGSINRRRDSWQGPLDMFKEGAELIGSNLNLGPVPIVIGSSNAKANSQAFSGSGANANAFATSNAQGAYAKDDYYGLTGQQLIKGANWLLAGPGQSNANGYDAAFDKSYLQRSGDTLIPQGAATQQNGKETASSIGTYNACSSGTPSCSNDNAAANAEATATANGETNSGCTGRIEAQNPLHGGGPQASGVYGNDQGNEHRSELGHYVPNRETSVHSNAAANAGSRGKVNDIAMTYYPIAPGWSWIPGYLFPPNTFPHQQNGTGNMVVVGNHNEGLTASKADAAATVGTSSSCGTDGSDGSSACRQGPSACLSSVNSTAHSNAHGESASSSSKSATDSSGNAMAQSSSTAIINSASKVDDNGGSSGVGGCGGNADNTGTISSGSASPESGLGGHVGSNRGSVAVNAKADAVVTASASNGSRTDGSDESSACRQGPSACLSSVNSTAHSNAPGESASSSSKSATDSSGNAMAQPSSTTISTCGGKSSASSHASASADTNV